MNKTFLAAALLLTACQQGASNGPMPGDAEDTQPFSAISEEALVRFVGTEPFWGGTVEDRTLTWSTVDDPEGERITVTRFAGRGGLTFSGTIDGEAFDLALTPAQCSDGMSDRTYPFAATVQLGAQQLSGCGWREGDDLGDPAP